MSCFADTVEKEVTIAQKPDSKVETANTKINHTTSKPPSAALSTPANSNTELLRLRKENRILKMALAVTLALLLVWTCYVMAFFR